MIYFILQGATPTVNYGLSNVLDALLDWLPSYLPEPRDRLRTRGFSTTLRNSFKHFHQLSNSIVRVHGPSASTVFILKLLTRIMFIFVNYFLGNTFIHWRLFILKYKTYYTLYSLLTNRSTITSVIRIHDWFSHDISLDISQMNLNGFFYLYLWVNYVTTDMKS